MKKNSTNIVDLLLFDHSYLKECIAILKDDDATKSQKLNYGRTFLDALQKHSVAEEKTVYNVLKKNEELRSIILEGQVEHGIADTKIRLLVPKLEHSAYLSEKNEIELKVLAEVVEHHIKEEESELFPKMRKELSTEVLNELGAQFFKIRKFKMKDLKGQDFLQEKLEELGTGEHRLSPNFADKVESLIK